MTWAWKTTHENILNEHLTERIAKVRSNSLPWMNSHIRKTMKRRFKALNLAKETGTKKSWDEYQKLRNEVTYLLRTAEASYWQEKFANIKSSKNWRLVGKLTNKKVIDPIGDDENNIILDDVVKAEATNDYSNRTNPCLQN